MSGISGMEIYVIANGDLFREAFNAIVTVLGTATFQTALRISVLFAVIATALNYIKGRDIAILGKWFIMYFAVTVILLGPKVHVHIIDSSDTGAVYDVDHVPYGLAFPASLITSIAHGLEEAMEEAFHMPDESNLPDDVRYSKTGMLFGSKVFGLSTAFHIVDPQVRADFNEYVKNCVLGDILINQKYSIKDLTNSKDLLSTISGGENYKPSAIRGILLKDGSFQTCQIATDSLKSEITQDVGNNAFTFFGKRIFGGRTADSTIAAKRLQESLISAYSYYANLSQSAEQIMTQNVLINGIRDGVLSYTTEAGATAALLNLSSTQTMSRIRMAWATSRNLATYVLPVMQTDILLLLLCLFPIIVLLSIHPSFGYGVFKNYIYSLLWIESWPLLFCCLNLAATFYLVDKTSGLATGGLTLSNSDQLALEHSDVANMAGYLMTCIPFLAIGLVRGMASAFSSASQYIGGMIHSTAAGAASEAVSGNISLGNASYGNINANKYDTNSTFMHGMATEQMANAATVTHTASGHDVWNTGGAMSHLATSVHVGSIASSSLSLQAGAAKSASIQDQHTYNHAVSSGASHVEQFGQSVSAQHGFGENYSTQETASAASHVSDMHSVVKSIADRNGVSWNEAFKGMTSVGQSAEGHAGLSTPGGGIATVNAGGSVSIKLDHSRTSDESTGHDVSTHINVTNEEMKKFSNDWNAIKQYSSTKHIEDGHSTTASELSQIAADFRTADSAASNYSSSWAESEHLTKLASFAEQHSDQISSNVDQIIAEHIQQKAPERAEFILGNTDNPRAIAEYDVYARQVLNSPDAKNLIEGDYNRGSYEGVNPSQAYRMGNETVMAKESSIKNEYQTNAKHIAAQAKTSGTGFDNKSYNQVKQEVQAGQQNANTHLRSTGSDLKDSYDSAQVKSQEAIKQGADKASNSPVSNGLMPIIRHPLDAITHPSRTFSSASNAVSIKPDFVDKIEKGDK